MPSSPINYLTCVGFMYGKPEAETEQQGAPGAGNFDLFTQLSIRAVDTTNHASMDYREQTKTLLTGRSTAEATRKKRSNLDAVTVVVASLTKRILLLLENMARPKRQKTSVRSASGISSKTRDREDVSSTASTEKSLSTTATGFEVRLRQNGVLRHDDPWLTPPSNIDHLMQQFQCNTAELTVPSEGQFRHFMDLAAGASSEQEMGAVVMRYLFKDNMDPASIAEGYRPKLGKQWLDYPKNQGFKNGLSNPKPDYVEGYRRSMFPPTVGDLGGAITLHHTAPNFVASPRFAAEFEGRDSNLHAARVQAGYDEMLVSKPGPLLISTGRSLSHDRSIGMQHLGIADELKYPAVVTAVTDGTVWHTYAHYQDVNLQTGDKVYYQYRVDSGTLDTYSNFRRGYQVLRNAQAFAKEQSRDVLNRLHEQYTAELSPPPSDDTWSTSDA